MILLIIPFLITIPTIILIDLITEIIQNKYE